MALTRGRLACRERPSALVRRDQSPLLPTLASSWVQTELLGRLAAGRLDVEACPLEPGALARLLVHLDTGRITGKMAKAIFERMWTTGADPDAEVEAMGEVVSDDSALQALVDDVLTEHPEQVASHREGKTQIFGFLMGQLMKRSQGRADPKAASAALRRALEAGR